MKFDWNSSRKSTGLGDTIHNFTTKTGIARVVDKISDVTGRDCGCAKRREKLNQKFPYKK